MTGSRAVRAAALAGATALALAVGAVGAPAALAAADAATPVKHVVVLFDENISFDHYFGTYPQAANTADEKLQGSGANAPAFQAAPGTPQPNTLVKAGVAGEKNPNTYKPFRFTPGQAVTCDQNHEYTAEQEAADGGKMDKFVEATTKDKCASSGPNMFEHPGEVMGYYDGNTVAAMWNLAQNFTINDNYWTSQWGPSTPGALNLIAGQTWGAEAFDPVTKQKVAKPDETAVGAPNADGVGTVYEDPDPLYDDCSNKNLTGKDQLVALQGRNVGDLLNDKQVSWGWFQGGFAPSTPAEGDKTAQCSFTHKNVAGNASVDYSPHHNPFAYYKSTANQHHVPPANVDEIGNAGPANHNYDLADFDKALAADKLPAVSFVKAASYQDGHAAYSDPLDEQTFIATYVNKLQKSKDWASTAVVIAYDDSDGWYDHQAPTILSGSKDAKLDTPVCSGATGTAPGGQQLRCGPGTRQPFLLISPFARKNALDHTYVEQASILKFVEDNWHLGRIENSFDERAGALNAMFDFGAPRTDKVWLDQVTGAVLPEAPPADQGAQAAGVKTAAPSPAGPTTTQQADASTGGSLGWLWAAIPIAVVILVGIALWALRKRRQAG